MSLYRVLFAGQEAFRILACKPDLQGFRKVFGAYVIMYIFVVRLEPQQVDHKISGFIGAWVCGWLSYNNMCLLQILPVSFMYSL